MTFKARDDFIWEYNDEPHTSRRRQILAKYPQMKKLFGYDWRTAIQFVITVLVQISMAYMVRDMDWKPLLVLTYVVSGTLNHSLSVGLHEISHNLVFGAHRPFANRLLGYFANLPMAVPAFVTFKKYHRDHHKYLGVANYDPDLPTRIEAKLFASPFGKIIYVGLLPLLYSVRPLVVMPKTMCLAEVVNLVIQLSFDYSVYHFWGAKALFYLVMGTMLGLGLHPISGHFIAEHYVFVKGYETYSYYGPLNLITFNVGYHNEHHDFPNIPCYRLGEVRKIAPEFYDNLPCHNSWIKVLYDFCMCEEMGPYSRIHRDYKYTSEFALLERKKKEAAMEAQLESSSKPKDESKKIN
jgi:sphingolipid delta-4 desaturase